MSAAEGNETPDPEAKVKKTESYEIKSLPIPAEVNFAGEPVPVERFDIRERLDREILSNTYFHSNTILMIKRANRYFPIIEPILKANNIPEDFKYIAMIESGFDPRVVSPAGAAGLWQFLRTTGREYGLEVDNLVDERYHVEKATEAACRYIQDAHDKFGTWTLAAASYNAGQNRITKELERQKTDSYHDMLLPEETKRYVFRAIALKEILKNPAEYGFHVRKEDLYPQIQSKKIKVTDAVENFADFAAQHDISYYMLKEFNPWLRDNYLTNTTHKTYIIEVPEKESLTPDPKNIVVYNNNWIVK